MNELVLNAAKLKKRIDRAYGWLKIKEKQEKIESLNIEMSRPDFWNDRELAAKIAKEAAELSTEVNGWQSLSDKITKLILKGETINKPSEEKLLKDILSVKNGFAELEFKMMLDGEHDERNAILSLHAGAGGTDAQDFALMLERMYLRYAENKKFKAKLIDRQSGAEAGIKSATYEINGKYAYGFLKSEAGVHRLVRISPFDAEKMRHTSFAMVEVLPEFEELKEVQIKDEDFKIDTFRSSGHGGQSVNTTDSAVRIKHLLTGITVNCQNERSQSQNKETAMKILKSKLHQYYLTEQEEERKKLRGEFSEAAWGNQIRSYVLHPYKQVKDHRSGYESQATSKILDGDLDDAIESYLKLPQKN